MLTLLFLAPNIDIIGSKGFRGILGEILHVDVDVVDVFELGARY